MRGPALLSATLLAVLCHVPAGHAGEGRPILVTVDDLPVAGGSLHASAEERRRITEELLRALARHEIKAVGLITWGNVIHESDRELLSLWLEAGHELGNHSHHHPSYTHTAIDDYIADVESAREQIASLLAPHGRELRYFRFPFLREGDTPGKLAAMRSYLSRTGQRNLPVTIDNQDWSYERPYVEARRAGDRVAMSRIQRDYLAALRLAVAHHERTGDDLFGRKLPQILLLHANAIGSAAWETLFDELAATGHRFASADEVLSDPVFREPHDYIGDRGPGLWDRLLHERRLSEARSEVEAALLEQIEAWNRGDLEEFCAIYAEDAVFVSPDGLTRGREAVLERYRKRYIDRAAMGRLRLDILEASAASGTEISMQGDARPSRVHGLSLVARWTLEYPDREAATGLTLIVLRRHGAAWVIVQDASM